MTRKVHLGVKVDTARRLFTFRIIGQCDGAELIDEICAAYEAVEASWLYDRIYDFRRCDGFFEYDQVERLAKWCAGYRPPDALAPLVCIVVPYEADIVRVRAVAPLFPPNHVNAFTSLDDALNWINDRRSTRLSSVA